MPYILFFEDVVDPTIARISAAYPDEFNKEILRRYKKKYDCSVDDRVRYDMIRKATNYFRVLLWIKDTQGAFIYNNRAYREIVLSSNFSPLFRTFGNFEENDLSYFCSISDLEVINRDADIRWIKHALFLKKPPVWMDIHKTPLHYPSGLICGTMGTGVNISNIMPSEWKDRFSQSCSLEIPVDTILTKKKITKILSSRSKRDTRNENT